MRLAALALLMLAACSPQKAADAPAAAPAAAVPAQTAAADQSTQPPGTAGSSGIGHMAEDQDSTFSLDPISLIGTWSFDRSCASGDGMVLSADGKAIYDEWGEGMWGVSAEGKLVLVLREHRPGVDAKDTDQRLVVSFMPKTIAGDDLGGAFAAVRPDIPAREVNAKRCP